MIAWCAAVWWHSLAGLVLVTVPWCFYFRYRLFDEAESVAHDMFWMALLFATLLFGCVAVAAPPAWAVVYFDAALRASLPCPLGALALWTWNEHVLSALGRDGYFKNRHVWVMTLTVVLYVMAQLAGRLPLGGGSLAVGERVFVQWTPLLGIGWAVVGWSWYCLANPHAYDLLSDEIRPPGRARSAMYAVAESTWSAVTRRERQDRGSRENGMGAGAGYSDDGSLGVLLAVGVAGSVATAFAVGLVAG